MAAAGQGERGCVAAVGGEGFCLRVIHECHPLYIYISYLSYCFDIDNCIFYMRIVIVRPIVFRLCKYFSFSDKYILIFKHHREYGGLFFSNLTYLEH